MGGPTNTERGLPDATLLKDPAFLSWAAKQGKPIGHTTPVGELGELLAKYEYEQRERARREGERAEQALAVAARTKALQYFARTPAAEADEELRNRNRAGWGRGDPDLKALAEKAVNEAVPLSGWLYGSHGADRDENRWIYMRHYLNALNAWFGVGALSEERLLDDVMRKEKIYLAKMKCREELRAWARKQPMNPVDNFEPGIAYYDLATAQSKSDWVDKDIKNIEQEDCTTTISYTRGQSLSFLAKSLDFKGKYTAFVVEAFVRRHKASGRLVPFVLYDLSADLYRDLPTIDALSSEDHVLLALQYMLTPAVQTYYARDPYLEIAGGLIKILQILALGARVVSAGTSTVAQLTTRSLALGRSVIAEIVFAVRTYGVSTQAAAYLGRSAYTYYLTNAVAVNTKIFDGADISLTICARKAGPRTSLSIYHGR